MPNYASLIFLSFNRPEFLSECVESARSNAGANCEVIVVDDGSASYTQGFLLSMLHAGKISKLILHPPGHNEGVGTSLNDGIVVSTGDPVVKIDQDMLFHADWLRTALRMLTVDPAIGMVGTFKYDHHPVVWEEMEIPWPETENEHHRGRTPYHYVRDFVGSVMVTPRSVLHALGPFPEHSAAFAEDIEYKHRIIDLGLRLALPDEDIAVNRGFGYGPSTVNVEPGKVQEIHDGPMIFDA